MPDAMVLRGAAHLHSLFSYDGRMALPIIAGRLRRRGLDFALLTEHNDGLGPSAIREIEAAAAQCSDGTFLVVPGLELRCDGGLHLLCLGALPDVEVGISMTAAIAAVHGEGGLAVWAHPPRAARLRAREDLLRSLDGVELWNGKRDSRFVLSLEQADWLRDQRAAGRGTWALAGLDLHAPGEDRGAYLEVEAAALTAGALLDALRQGHHALRLGPWRVGAAGEVSVVSRWANRLAERRAIPLARRARSILGRSRG
ncbi:MAG: PHP domain-containing protein [Myxococcales bacterium]